MTQEYHVTQWENEVDPWQIRFKLRWYITIGLRLILWESDLHSLRSWSIHSNCDWGNWVAQVVRYGQT